MQDKRVLVVAYIFPPLASSGVHRTLRFVKHLPSFGWEPVVLTPRSGIDSAYDKSMLDRIPRGLSIYRTRSFRPFRGVALRRAWLHHMVLNEQSISATPRHGNLFGAVVQKPYDILKALLRSSVLVPDDKIGWIPFAVWSGLRIMSRNRIDLIYATGGPFTALLIGAILKTLTGKPLVADFRDPWVDNPYFESASPLARFLNERFESWVVNSADLNIYNTVMMEERARKKYPTLGAQRFRTLTNGYDEEDFEGLTPHRSTVFTITHAGSFYGQRDVRGFLSGLRMFLDESPHMIDRVRFINMGRLGNGAMEYIEASGLSGVVHDLGAVGHKECLQKLMDSDALLLVEPEYVFIPAKVFEYLRAGKPILALTPRGSAARVIEVSEAGVVLDPHNISGIKEAIGQLYRSRETGSSLWRPSLSVVESYDARILTASLASIFDAVTLQGKETCAERSDLCDVISGGESVE